MLNPTTFQTVHDLIENENVRSKISFSTNSANSVTSYGYIVWLLITVGSIM